MSRSEKESRTIDYNFQTNVISDVKLLMSVVGYGLVD